MAATLNKNNHSIDKKILLYILLYKCPKEYFDLYSNVTDEKRRKILGLITLLDDSIGNLTRTLKERDLLDNTLIYFLSDVKVIILYEISIFKPRETKSRKKNNNIWSIMTFF